MSQSCEEKIRRNLEKGISEEEEVDMLCFVTHCDDLILFDHGDIKRKSLESLSVSPDWVLLSLEMLSYKKKKMKKKIN